MIRQAEKHISRKQEVLISGTFLISAATILADSFIHPGGISNATNRQLFPELVRDYLGNSAAVAILVTPFLALYSGLKSADTKASRALAKRVIKLAAIGAIIAGGDIELVTSADVANPQALPDFIVGTTTALAMICSAKGAIDILYSHSQVAEPKNIDRLFDQPSLFHPSLATSADQIFG